MGVLEGWQRWVTLGHCHALSLDACSPLLKKNKEKEWVTTKVHGFILTQAQKSSLQSEHFSQLYFCPHSLFPASPKPRCALSSVASVPASPCSLPQAHCPVLPVPTTVVTLNFHLQCLLTTVYFPSPLSV